MTGHRFILSLFVMLIVIAVSDGCGRRRSRRPVRSAPSISCPRVRDVTAPRLSTSVRVRWGSPSVSDEHGGWSFKRVTRYSSGSLFNEGSHTVIYKVTNRAGLIDTCSFSFRVNVVRCPPLFLLRNGRVECGRFGNIYGRTCEFSCNDGYWLDGHSSSTCQRNGQNSHRIPTCRSSK